MNNTVFDAPVPATLEHLRQPSNSQAQELPTMMLKIAGQSLIALLVIAFEAHVVYATFEFVFGHNSAIWAPWIMAFASLILVLAVHFMAHKNANHPVIMLLNRLTGVLIPLYLIGIGALIIASLYNGGLGDMLSSSSVDLNLDSLDAPAQGQWLDSFMGEYVTPLAGVLFSFGIGSLAIVSVFVAHHALTKAETLLVEAMQLHKAAKADEDDFNSYHAARDEFITIQKQIDDLMINTGDNTGEALADEVLLTIQKALEPTLALINQEKFSQRPKGLTPPSQTNVSALEKAIKPIQSINRADIVKHFK